MEFFAEIKNNSLTPQTLKEKLSIQRLPEFCKSIDTVLLDNTNSGKIYCLWGEFIINREEISRGVRFTLPHCPNAIAWTISCDEDSDIILIHCTMNKKTHDADFIESVELFVNDWHFNSRTKD